MRVDALAVRLRPRSAFEAADLGVRLGQSDARTVYVCYLAVATPVVLLALSASEIATALDRGARYAGDLVEAGRVHAAALHLKGETRLVGHMGSNPFQITSAQKELSVHAAG